MAETWCKEGWREAAKKGGRQGQKNIIICVKTHGLYTGVTGET